MKKKEYYVYGLIDPRDDEYFYIGKGKGKRFSSHLKPKRLDFNYAKLDRIKEIHKSGLEVKIEVLFPNLDEYSAFELEKIVIYRLGRAVFSEGILTNLTPGGKWKPGDRVFYPKDFKPDFDINKLDFVSQQKFIEIPNLSEFKYLKTDSNEQSLYKFDTNGSFEKELSLNELFCDGIKDYKTKLLKVLRDNNLPIYSRWIYSKNKYNSLYVSENIPFAEFDVIDQDFNRDFDIKFKETINLIITNAPVKIIHKNKSESEIVLMFNEIIDEIKKIELREKIQFLEDKVSLNLDETLYSELLSLRNQLKGG